MRFPRPSTCCLRCSVLCCQSMLLIFRVTERSYYYVAIIWQDRDNIAGFFLSLGSLESHCSSLARSGCNHMIFPDLIVIGMRPLASYCFAKGLITSNHVLGLEHVCWKVTFGKVPNSRVTMFAVTLFCSDFKVRTPVWIKV